MKEIVFNNKKYSIPQKWEEVSVRMIIRAAELSEILEEAPIVAIITAYTGIPIEDLKANRATEVNLIMENMDFIIKQYVPKPRTSFNFKGVEYSCASDIVDISFEDWVSVQTALYNYREEEYKVLPKLIAILCKKDKESLSDFDLNERTELFMDLPMTYAKDIEGFFLHSLNAYKSLFLVSSTTDLQKELVQSKLVELKSIMRQSKERDGISFGMKCVIGIYQIYLWWVGKKLVKYFSLESTNNSKKTWMQTFKLSLTRILAKDKSK